MRPSASITTAMPYNPDAHRRRSIRLPGYDYAQPGAYFVTICTQDRAILLERPDVQETISYWWNALPPKFPNLETDAFVVMPNHIHGILTFVGAAPRGRPVAGQPHGVAPTLGDVVGWFKTMTTNAYIRGVKDRAWPPFDRRLWQRNYYEHVIRTDDDLDRIRQYILDNPARWGYDHDNPLGQPDRDETAFWETLGPGEAHLPRG